MQKRWRLTSQVNPIITDQYPEINGTILQLLFNRQLTASDQIERFIDPDFTKDLHDPFLFSDMEKAVNRILQAIEKKERIVVYGDYDADGVTSTAVMREVLTSLGATVSVYIPYRETEGYGMNIKAVTELADQGTSLLITVDCGISNAAEVEILKQRGVDVIITDHHLPPDVLPDSFATINPNVKNEKYPFRGLAGCGVAFKVAQALLKKQHDYKVTHLHEGWEKWLLDLVAMGTVADMQPLLDENRVLVKFGLVVLNKTRRPGLLHLFKTLGNKAQKVDEHVIGWQISPRLNAAGRINHANTAYELLITTDETRAEALANELNAANRERQSITEKIKTEAEQLIVGDVGNQQVLIAVGEGWPTGMVGLVAGKITDTYHIPSLVISRYNGEIIGSGRSIEEFNIMEALKGCSDNFVKFGGHAGACGFTIKDEQCLRSFIEYIRRTAQEQLSGLDISPTLDIESEIDLDTVTWDLFEQLQKFAPYGEGNPRPLFVSSGLTVQGIQALGKDSSHLRLMVSSPSGKIKKTIGFGLAEKAGELRQGDRIDIVFEVSVNEWNGNRELQLTIVDFKLSEQPRD